MKYLILILSLSLLVIASVSADPPQNEDGNSFDIENIDHDLFSICELTASNNAKNMEELNRLVNYHNSTSEVLFIANKKAILKRKTRYSQSLFGFDRESIDVADKDKTITSLIINRIHHKLEYSTGGLSRTCNI